MSFDCIKALANQGIAWEQEVCLAPYTSFHIGGNCRVMVKPKTAEEVRHAVAAAKSAGMDYAFLGNGSNMLVADEGYNGMIILTTSLAGLSLSDLEPQSGLYLLECGAGVSLSKLCSTALEERLEGLEFAWGIPGTTGGAVYMNAGAYGGEIRDVLYDCTFLNEAGELETLPNGKLDLAYRHSIFSNRKCCILRARFSLRRGDPAEIKVKMDDYITRRKTKQPLEYPSAGSTFKRPEGNYASALIEQCGLKGRTVGGAQVSEKHSGFLINKGGATCRDVLELIDLVKREVREKTGYELECEVKRL